MLFNISFKCYKDALHFRCNFLFWEREIDFLFALKYKGIIRTVKKMLKMGSDFLSEKQLILKQAIHIVAVVLFYPTFKTHIYK